MKHFRVLVIIVCLSILSVGCSSLCPAQVTRTVNILHTSDTHAQTLPDDNDIGGYAIVSRFMNFYKADHDNVLILDAGDKITGSPVSTLFEGKPIFEIMNTMPYDVSALGNHEFDHGWDKIDGFMEIMDSPLLNSNLRKPDGGMFGDGAVAYRMVNGVRIGIIGVITSDFYRVTATVGHEGVEVTNAAEAVAHYLPEVERNSDLVVVLSHCGLAEDKKIAEMNPGVDLIIGGHSHTVMQEPIKVGQTVIMHPGAKTRYVAELNLKVDIATGTISEYRGRLIPMSASKYPPDPVTNAVVRHWEDKVADLVNVEIGENKEFKKPEELRLIIAAVLKQKYKTDLGFQNLGGVRNTLPEGVILKKNIWQILPFINKIVILKLDREELVQVHALFGGFNVPTEDASRSDFTLVTNDYVADQIISNLELEESQITRHESLLAEEMIQYIQKTGAFEMPVE